MQQPRLSSKLVARSKALNAPAKSVREAVTEAAGKAVKEANKTGRNKRGQLCREGVGPDGWCKRPAYVPRVDSVVHKWEKPPKVDTVYVYRDRPPTGGSGGTTVNVAAVAPPRGILKSTKSALLKGRKAVSAIASGYAARIGYLAAKNPRTAKVLGTGARVGLKVLTRGRI